MRLHFHKTNDLIVSTIICERLRVAQRFINSKFMTYWKKYKLEEPQHISSIENPTVLGFSAYYHDSSAAIVRGDEIIAAAEEERFTRVKHDASFPKNAITFCLRQAGAEQVDAVVYYENPDIKWRRIQETLANNRPSKNIYTEIMYQWQYIKTKAAIQQTFQKVTGLKNKVIFLDHHLSHAASSFLFSGFIESAIVTIDAVGEKNTTTWGYGKGSQIKLQQCIEIPESIGLMYTAFTTFLGFKANEGEYKVMGLAPYGEQNKSFNSYYPKLKKFIAQKSDGSYKLNMKYFGHNGFEGAAFTEHMSMLFGVPPRQNNQPITSAHKNIAAALQLVTEEVVLKILLYVHSQTNSDNLCLAGGVALNSVLNGKILDKTPFKHLYI